MSATPSIDERLSALETKLEDLGPLLAVRDERDHWIGEAKRYQVLYRTASDGNSRNFAALRRLREEGDERAAELERVLDVVYEASKRLWPLIRSGATEQEIRKALDWISQIADEKTLAPLDEGEGGDRGAA